MTESFQYIPIDQLHESPTNPRHAFGDLTELASSVKAKGIYEPLLARPILRSKLPAFELVFGHRRLRAAKLAELAEVPVMVREMSDREALEAQLIENAARADLHPLEEAAALQQLHEQHGIEVEELAARVGKSRAYVYSRLKLCSLAPKVREAFFKGTLPASHALLVARIPHADLQVKALDALTPEDWKSKHREAVPYREAVSVMHSQFMLRLADAPFATADALLVPEAGACSTCPKRTGNQRELFSDVAAKDDLCTDPKCFATKRDAAWAEKAAKLEAEGHTVPTEKEAKKLVTQYGLSQEARDQYMRLGDNEYRDPKGRTVGALLGKKHGLRLTVVRDQQGNVHELVEKKEAQKVIREKHEWARPQPKESKGTGTSAAVEKGKADRKVREKAAELAMVSVLDAQAKQWPSDAWRSLAVATYQLAEDPELVLRRRGLLSERKHRGYRNDATTKALRTAAKDMEDVALRGLALEFLCSSFDGYDTDALKLMVAGFGLDMKRFEAEAKRQLEEAAKPKAEAKPAQKLVQVKPKKGGRR